MNHELLPMKVASSEHHEGPDDLWIIWFNYYAAHPSTLYNQISFNSLINDFQTDLIMISCNKKKPRKGEKLNNDWLRLLQQLIGLPDFPPHT